MEPLDIVALRDIWSPTQHVDEEPDNQTVIKIIEFLNTHPTFIKENPDQAKNYLGMLEKADLTAIPDNSWKTYSTLVKNYPDLFPKENLNMITIKMGKKEIALPKNSLLAQNKKFRAAFKQDSEVSKTKILNFDSGNYDEKSIDDFFLYLEKGEILLSGDNVWDLYLIADEHNFNKLKKSSTKFLKNSIDLDNWKALLDLSIRTNNPNLGFECFKFAVNTKDEYCLKKVEKILKKNPQLATQFLVLATGKSHFNDIETTPIEELIKEDNVHLCTILAESISNEKIQTYCTVLKNFIEAKELPINIEQFSNTLNSAINHNFKKIVWNCLLLAQEHCINDIKLEQAHQRLQKVIASFTSDDTDGYKIVLNRNNVGHIDFFPHSVQKQNIIKCLSPFFDLTLNNYGYAYLMSPLAIDDLFNSSVPFTVLNICYQCSAEELLPLFNKMPLLKGFYDMAKRFNNYNEFIEYAKHFAPLNENSKIYLNGVSLGKDFPKEDLDKIFKLYPNF